MKKILLFIPFMVILNGIFAQKNLNKKNWAQLSANTSGQQPSLSARATLKHGKFGIDFGSIDKENVAFFGVSYVIYNDYKKNIKAQPHERLLVFLSFYRYLNSFNGWGPGIFALWERGKISLEFTTQIGIGKSNLYDFYNFNMIKATRSFGKKINLGIETESRAFSSSNTDSTVRTITSVGPIIKYHVGGIETEISYNFGIKGGHNRLVVGLVISPKNKK